MEQIPVRATEAGPATLADLLGADEGPGEGAEVELEPERLRLLPRTPEL